MINKPSSKQFNRMRLILSTYQDGTGMLKNKRNPIKVKTLPGWRDFERAVAIAFDGEAPENKSIYDVLVNHPDHPNYQFGISCKMRNTLGLVDSKGIVTIELSNASGEFWDLLRISGINQQNYENQCAETGIAIIDRVELWHQQHDWQNNGKIITEDSYFLSLQYNNKTGYYQLFQFPVQMPNPENLSWTSRGRHLIGKFKEEVLIEWYGLSGGQLKYYPKKENAVWTSDRFQLEALPEYIKDPIQKKAALYFPNLWED